MSKNILLVAPVGGNGGINSWTRKYLNSFNSIHYRLLSVDSSLKHRSFNQSSLFLRSIAGLLDLNLIVKEVKKSTTENTIDIMHTTTSGSLGTLRDFVLAKMMKKRGIKTILHCRYGNIPHVLKKRSLLSYFLIRTMCIYDEVWVLDSKSVKALKEFQPLKDKVQLIPNCIEVNKTTSIPIPKDFKTIGFIGNLIPSKGIFELIEAVLNNPFGIKLKIVGPGHRRIIKRVKDISIQSNKKIEYVGALKNSEVINFLDKIDVLALPTYYPSEAFPISILEAMSKGKLVISTKRAAIPDILTSLDGSDCGIFVKEKDHKDLQLAFEFINDNKELCRTYCKKALEKVWSQYRLEIVYSLYESRYSSLCK